MSRKAVAVSQGVHLKVGTHRRGGGFYGQSFFSILGVLSPLFNISVLVVLSS